VKQLAIGDVAVTTVASTTAKAAALVTGSTLGAIPFALVGAWAAQAAVATRKTWRQAAAQEQQLRNRLLALPPRR
jgi:acetylornithine/succinyldiaminopimelate/putrescine aminotransferase